LNDRRTRKRVVWLAAIAGVLLVSLLFITLFAPSTPASSGPVIRPADGAAPATTSPSGQSFSIGGGEAISLVWRLGLVAVIIAVSIVGLRWWGKRTAGPRSTTGFLRIVDTLAISNGRAIHLVALGDRVIAVGATAQQLTLLNELSEEEGRTVLEGVRMQGDQPLAGFAAELLHSMRRSTRVHPRTPESVIGEELS
jgi:flagellar biogenesis protein FliO